jgi:hypothetical protein
MNGISIEVRSRTKDYIKNDYQELEYYTEKLDKNMAL